MLILSVSQINRYISFKLKEDKKLSGVMIRGEISNFTAHRSGHFYFTLKDNESAIKAVMFRSNAQKVKFMPQDGMNVIAMGSISVFERDGVYQIYVTDIIPDGVGSVYIANQQLREKLRKEGIFDESAKRPLPQLPKKIGAVTSETGAALQDIINVLSRRYPVCELMVFNTLVQGTDAADSISRSMMNAARADCDVIILARGGGSLEDLSAFNTENVAYAIYNSSVPVISAVGHETDVTIADLAADLRAPTPSAAAEMVSLSAEQIYGNIKYYEEKLKGLIETCLNNLNAQLEKTNERLLRFSPDQKNEKSILKYGELTKRLDKAYEKIISEKENEFISSVSKLEAMSPVSVLMRGYSLVYRNDRIVSRTSELTENDNVTIRLSDGKATAKIISLEGK